MCNKGRMPRAKIEPGAVHTKGGECGWSATVTISVSKTVTRSRTSTHASCALYATIIRVLVTPCVWFVCECGVWCVECDSSNRMFKLTGILFPFGILFVSEVEASTVATRHTDTKTTQCRLIAHYWGIRIEYACALNNA